MTVKAARRTSHVLTQTEAQQRAAESVRYYERKGLDALIFYVPPKGKAVVVNYQDPENSYTAYLVTFDQFIGKG